MRKTLLFFFLISIGCSFSQTIENVDFRAEGESIVVTYDFLHPKADTSVNIELQFKDQKGSVITPKTLIGDLKDVKLGQEKRIVWDVIADGVILSGKYKAELKIIQYNSVKIGNQVWMTENLNVDRFRNGDPIYEAKTVEEWINAGKEKKPAWCHFNNDPKNTKKYGKLYNWYAVNDPRGLAPVGWYIPTEEDILKLFNELGGGKIAKQAIKSKTGWGEYGNGTNHSKLNALPNGIREGDEGDFRGGSSLQWWTSSLHAKYPEYPIDLYISQDVYDQPFYISYSDKMNGMSVRCLSTLIFPDNHTYHIIKSSDNLSRIAAKYNTTVSNICRLNNIKPTSSLTIGQKLRIK
jgi:uncharacterized protein (TIGR02145 family)